MWTHKSNGRRKGDETGKERKRGKGKKKKNEKEEDIPTKEGKTKNWWRRWRVIQLRSRKKEDKKVRVFGSASETKQEKEQEEAS